MTTPTTTTHKRGRGIGRLAGYEPTEAQVQATIVQWLELRGYVFTVTDRSRHWDAKGRVRASRVSMPGWPDLVLVLPPNGQLFAVEVKSKRGQLSPQQRACHARLQAVGAVVVVARSLEDVMNVLERKD